MFGLKLKSWMEAHLGRPHRQKSTSSSGSGNGSTSCSGGGSSQPQQQQPPPLTCSSVSSSSHQKIRTGAPKDNSGSSSTSNSTTSSSNVSTSTAIGLGPASLLLSSNNSSNGNNHPNPSCNFQPTTDFTTTSTESSISSSAAAAAAVGSESVTGSVSACKKQQQEVGKIGKYCGSSGGNDVGGGGSTIQQKGETIGTKDSEIDSHSHAPGESDPDQHHNNRISSSAHTNTNTAANIRASTVSTSVSNSTSILSGGSSFSNSLSSPDTGYSTDGYSPKSVYPALSFATEGRDIHHQAKHSSSAASSSSKSSYTISSLVSSELSSDSKQTSASCSVHDGLDDHHHTPSPAALLLTSSQSSSSGISDTSSGGVGGACFPKGHLLQHSIPENDSSAASSKEKQVIMGLVGGVGGGTTDDNKKSIQLELGEQKFPIPSGISTTAVSKATVKAGSSDLKTHSKFSPFSIDFLKRSSSTCNNNSSSGGGNNDDGDEGERDEESNKQYSHFHGRTHRRAESMDARTPSHEDYKPLVEPGEDAGGDNPSSSSSQQQHFMTSSSSAAAGKSIRTSFVLNPSGQIVELNSYKNAYSICSPRRERTRIKTNPWITLSNNKKDGSKSGSDGDATTANSTDANNPSSGSEEETEKQKKMNSGKVALETGKLVGVKVDVEEKNGGAGKRVGNLLEINKKNEKEQQELKQHPHQEHQNQDETDNFMEDETGIVDHDSDDRSSSTHHILYRISSASDSGKGSLVESTETNRNSTESSCLLSEDSTRNSIISQEASGSSCCGRSSSGESISQHQNHDHHNDTLIGHGESSEETAAKASVVGNDNDQKEQQEGHSHQKKNGDQGQRTFRNASVATTDLLVVKSASVSVGVGTTGSNKSAKNNKQSHHPQHPVMVDKETDILSDWATNTDMEDTEDDLETDRDDEDGENNEDNETVTPAPSSPGTDVDRALFSQSSSATTDIDFGDSSAATQASSTQVFPPSSLLRGHNTNHRGSSNMNINSNAYANMGNGVHFHNNSGGSNNNSQSESCGGESYEHHYQLQQSHHQQQHNNINMNSVPFPAVVPIVRPVLVAAQQQQQQQNQDGTFSFDLVNHHHHQQHLFNQHTSQLFYPNYPVLEDDLLEDDYPQVKPSSGHHKGLARGALGFLRKIFKKGACSSQRHSPDSLASSATGKKKGKGKSDNNLASLGRGLGSPLMTISEPLSNPRYSAAVLTTKKQINPTLNGCYFLTPTPNSFRRRSGGSGGVGGIFGIGGQSSDPNNSGSDSKGSSSSTSKHSHQHPPKSVKTDIIRLPQGTLSPQQSIIQPIPSHHPRANATTSSHSSGSSSTSSALSITNGGIPIPPLQQQQQCSTFLPHAAPVLASSFFPAGSGTAHQTAVIQVGNNGNLIATISQQSNNSSSTSSSVHSLMSTSTCSGGGGGGSGGNNRPPSQPKTPIPITQNLYANSSQNPITCSTTNGRHSTNPFTSMSNNNNGSSNVTARSPPPPYPPVAISQSENSPYLNGSGGGSGIGKSQHQSRRDLPPTPQQSMKGVIPSYDSSQRIPPNSSTSSAAAVARMNSPSFNNYSPIHRLVVTGGSHLRNGNPPACSNSGQLPTYPSTSTGESPLPIPRYNGNSHNNHLTGTDNNTNNFGTQVINRSHHPSQSMSQSPLINHRSSPHPQQQQQPSHNFFASPSPILRNPRYQYITSSNQNSPVLNATKRLNGSTSNSGCGGSTIGPNGPPPLLTTFSPLPSTSSSSSHHHHQRESLINNNNHHHHHNSNANSTNTITISSGGGAGTRQVVSTSLSYNEFENLSRQQHQQHHHQQNFSLHHNKNGNNGTFISPQQQQQILHQNHHKNNKTHHNHQANHYYSSPIVKQRQLEQQTLWNNNDEGGAPPQRSGRQYQNHQQHKQHFQQQRANENLRFNSFLVRHRQLPQFYHTQWGLQERIYETVDSEDERTSPSGRMNGDDDDDERDLSYGFGGGEREKRIFPGSSRMKHSFSHREGGFLNNHVNGDGEFGVVREENEEEEKPTKRTKPKSLSASGRPFPRPVVALPMMPAGTFLSETETRLLEVDKESDRKYKRLINEAEALLKEISVEKEKRALTAAVAACVTGGGAVGPGASGGASGHHHRQRDNNPFRVEDCPQSDPLRRKGYDCWALRRLQQELAGCCVSPPVLHRSRLNLQSPSTPTGANNPYLSHFQNIGLAMSVHHNNSQQGGGPLPLMLPQQVPYMSSSTKGGGGGPDQMDPNQNSFEF